MTRKKRNYRAEYKRRIASAVKRGFTKSQGRGHPAKREAPIKVVELKRAGEIEKEEFVAMLIEQGKSARDAYTAWYYS